MDRYVSGIEYTAGFYPELTPIQTELTLILNGWSPPQIKKYCELGFGRGLSLAVNSLVSGVACSGTDLNTNHVAFARNLVASADPEVGKSFYDKTFDTFFDSKVENSFDYIAAHGVWSWVSAQCRLEIKAAVKKKLQPGGILYLSYNLASGHGALLPVKNIFQGIYDGLSDTLPKVERIEEAVRITKDILNTESVFSNISAATIKTFDTICEKSLSYVAHELLNKDWHLEDFCLLEQELKEVGLIYAGSADIINTFDSVNYTEDQLAKLKSIKSLGQSESIKDLWAAQTFRKDYWIKGGVPLTLNEIYNHLKDFEFHLCTISDIKSIELKGRLIKASLSEDIYTDVLLELQNNYVIDVDKLILGLGHDISVAFEILKVLLTTKIVLGCRKGDIPSQISDRAKVFNKEVVDRVNSQVPVLYLISTKARSAIDVSYLSLQFLKAIVNGVKNDKQIVELVWEEYEKKGKKFVEDGKTAETIEENKIVLNKMFTEFNDHTFPLLQRLGCLDFLQ